MSRLFHYDFDGRARFVAFNTHRRLPLLTNHITRSAVIEAIKTCRSRNPFRLAAYVIMPEHVHLVLTPDIETVVSKVVAEIKACSARTILDEYRRTDNPLLLKLTVTRNRMMRHVFWQRRCYDHNCRSDESFWGKVEYCHNNPVKRGLVKSAGQWKWSSYNYYFGARDYLLEMDYERIIQTTTP